MILDRSALRKIGLGLSAATELILSVVVGCGAGYLLDRWIRETYPWLTVLCTLVGFVGGFYRLYRVMIRDDQDSSRTNGDNSDSA